MLVDLAKKFDKVIKSRAEKRVGVIEPLLITTGVNEFYLAGGALNAEWKDIDLFPVSGKFKRPSHPISKYIVAETKNAITLKWEGKTIVQFCNYLHPSLYELVRSFDFTHVQVGVKVEKSPFGFEVGQPYYTSDFVIAQHAGTRYVGSEYPLSSLVRLLKFHKRSLLPHSVAIWTIIQILNDIAGRGFKGYEDFKDQLDAVDLGLVPEELAELEQAELLKVFSLFNKEEGK